MTSQNELELLQDIATTPRPTGSVALSTALQRVELELSGLGFETKERAFEFSAFPGRFATPLFGASILVAVGVAGHLGSQGQRWIPLAICVLTIAVLVPVWRWLATRGVLEMPLMRQKGINLVATRLGALPRVWLCAHLDTKSQPVPSLLRMIGAILLGIGFAATLGLSALAAAGFAMHPVVWAAFALMTLAGAVPVVLSVVGNRSPGALDNASGVATVIAAARAVPNDSDIGVLITDAEELGLAGAHAWARSRGGGVGGVVLNCDGVDDGGANVVMYSGARPEAIARAVQKAIKEAQTPAQLRRMAFGLLTDSVAFTAAGLDSVTFSRGGYASLARVHSRRDNLEHLRGTGIAEVASLMAATARHLS
jgi:hypothetical protein